MVPEPDALADHPHARVPTSSRAVARGTSTRPPARGPAPGTRAAAAHAPAPPHARVPTDRVPRTPRVGPSGPSPHAQGPPGLRPTDRARLASVPRTEPTWPPPHPPSPPGLRPTHRAHLASAPPTGPSDSPPYAPSPSDSPPHAPGPSGHPAHTPSPSDFPPHAPDMSGSLRPRRDIGTHAAGSPHLRTRPRAPPAVRARARVAAPGRRPGVTVLAPGGVPLPRRVQSCETVVPSAVRTPSAHRPPPKSVPCVIFLCRSL